MQKKLSIALGCALLAAASITAGAAPESCSANPAYHALDFTLGRWNIAGPSGDSEGSSIVDSSLSGCAVVEDWAAGSESGRNIDAYSREDGHWYRMFINSRGQVHTFKGETHGSSVEYTGTSTEADGSTALNELTVRKNGSNGLIQTWRQSRDGGKTWQNVFRGIYSRKG